MHMFQAGELLPLILEVLLAATHPQQTLAAVAVLIVAVIMMEFKRRAAPMGHLVALWALAASTLVLWLVCTLVLRRVGVL